MKKILTQIAVLVLAIFTIGSGKSYGQSITVQPASQTVAVGAMATFTITVSGGPCRIQWVIGGVGSYGAMGSTFSYSIMNVTAAMNGETVFANIYGCTGGTANLVTNTAMLTVGTAPPPPDTISPTSVTLPVILQTLTNQNRNQALAVTITSGNANPISVSKATMTIADPHFGVTCPTMSVPKGGTIACSVNVSTASYLGLPVTGTWTASAAITLSDGTVFNVPLTGSGQ
jgi:hypothetical protein